ncbi:PDZ domain-containing protein 8 [Trichomycterus rosablanca]|uniref:PDZ domain-containing protein 8 n=1 Tax=Trichomycterus rosablanca TaxID=2290929 RepID=UPI002F355E4F
MIYLVLISAFVGAVVTLLLQLALLYRRSPEPVGRTVQYVKAVPDPALKDYFTNPQPAAGQQDGTAAKAPDGAGSGASPGASPGAGAPGVGAPQGEPETCGFLNAIFLFLFRELRDTPLVRHWITKKIRVEFEELLQTKTAGRLLEGLCLRDVSLGDSVPVFKSARLMRPVRLDDSGMPEELNFEVDLEYAGGFHLAVDVDLVFGKSAYLFVKMRRVAGRLRLRFSRFPFTHWSFSFLEDPLVDFEVKSQFEGRPLPQLTSIIVNQLKRVIKKKHTLPNYKIRYKPFFPFQVQPAPEPDFSVQDERLVEGRLRVTLVECSRLFILGSYDRETYVHCTIELSSHEWKEKPRSSIKRTEVIKGPNGSVGMTFRHVPAIEGDVVHVSIETVTPNSPAAQADLQKGDRLIAIGGVKVTSSVQVPKLLKQAGERVVVLYERPIRHQMSAMNLPPLQDTLGPLEEPGYPMAGGYEEDPAHITTMDVTEVKDNDSEFEELLVEPKPAVAPVSVETKEDSLLSVNQSPKKTVANLASKPLGTISPILNRKLNLSGLQSPLKPQPKESPKPSPHKTAEPPEPPQRPTVPPPPPPVRPPVPPRPHIKVTTACSESPNTASSEGGESTVEKSSERAPPPASNGEKPAAEKSPTKVSEPKPVSKPAETADELPAGPLPAKQDTTKDKIAESSFVIKDSMDEQGLWQSSEAMFRNRYARWSKSSVVFDVESHHKYLNVALWCKDPFKLGSLLCLGHVSLHLEHVALECLCISSAEYQSNFSLCAPEPRASVSRTALRSLSTHKGFNEKLCYGDITLNFTYLGEGDSDLSSGLTEQEGSSQCEELRESERERDHILADLSYNPMQLNEVRHNFQDTQFQNPTWCDYCKKKVWTKAASQCIVCAYVCHKKCQEKCLAEHPFCLSITDRRSTDPEAKSPINRATTGLTRHIINTSSRLLNLRQVPKARLAEQTTDAGPGVAEPSPKHTPNTSDNESSDTETYTGASPSKQPSSGGTKLARKEGGLDDSVFIAVKEIGRDLYRGLPTDERSQKLELMLDKLQQEIDQELEHNNSLIAEERETNDARRKALITSALTKSGERLQALTLLMIHYRAGFEDLESLESTPPSEQHGFSKSKSAGLEEDLMSTEVYDSDVCSPVDVLNDISEEQLCVEAMPR